MILFDGNVNNHADDDTLYSSCNILEQVKIYSKERLSNNQKMVLENFMALNVIFFVSVRIQRTRHSSLVILK